MSDLPFSDHAATPPPPRTGAAPAEPQLDPAPQAGGAAPTDAPAGTVPAGTAPSDPPAGTPTAQPPRTRLGAVWVGICAAVLVLIVLIIFMMQNTGTVEVTFLWMHGGVPLALALLIATVGGSLVVLVLGTARIVQLRWATRRAARAPARR